LLADVTNFFGSIRLERVLELIYARTGKTRPAQAVESILTLFNELPDRSGLPQRSTASSLVANAFLGPIDDVLRHYTGAHSAAVLRWMDDIWVFGGGTEYLRRLQLDLQDELRNLGLEINLGKTMIREGDEALAVVAEQDLERNP